MTLSIYLADLTHVGVGKTVATEAFPLNIGLVAAYAIKTFGDDVDIRLFKYPDDLAQAIAAAPPHILGCSNYTWNANLSRYFTNQVKALSPDTLTVWGGTNYPFDAKPQESFLRHRPELDVHIFYEGEQAFADIVARVLKAEKPTAIFDAPLAGSQFIDPQTDAFVSGASIPRMRCLDDVPSPYATGLLDQFFDGTLTPLVETARGCPFRCNYCNAGDTYFNKVNTFSNEYVEDELTYIAQKAAQTKVGHVTFADNNFGMIPRDEHTAEVVHRLQEKYGWPNTMTVWTGKNAKERVIEVTRLLEKTIQISMSVQSMDDTVLKNISRDNIKLDHYRAIAAELDRQGRRQHAEVIMPLPGETLDSHFKGLNELLDTKLQNVLSHTLQMLHGTPYKDDPDYVRDNGYVSKWRLVPLDFSHIGDDFIFDVEEVGIQTKDLSFEEYLEARKYLLTIDLCFNSRIFMPLVRFLQSRDIAVSAWIGHVFEKQHKFSDAVRSVFDSFVTDTKGELWDSEQDLIAYYSRPEVFEKLIAGDVGGNVLFKHRVWMMTAAAEAWVEDVFTAAAELLGDDSLLAEGGEFANIKQFVLGTVSNSCSPETVDQVVTMEFTYDVPQWMEADEDAPLGDFAMDAPRDYSFGLNERERDILKDAFSRYGTDVPGLVKLIQRIVSMPYRKVIETDAVNAPGDMSPSSVGRISL